MNHSLVAFACVALAGSTAGAQLLHSTDFEGGNTGGWTVNGNQMLFDGGNPGQFMGIPLIDTWGVTLANSQNPDVIGDLTRHGGPLRFDVDIRTLNLINFNGDQIDPGFFPLVLQLVDSDITGPSGPASVYLVSDPLPPREDAWTSYSFIIPDPTSASLPPGWGGTGDEDPDTFEPILPPGITYTQVLQGVDEFRLTTFVPGMFYTSNFWEVGFDNVSLSVVPAPGGLALLGGAGLLARRRRRH